jgi:cytoskeletal protein RodZ
VTLRKTLTGALAALFLLIAGFSGVAVAQEDTDSTNDSSGETTTDDGTTMNDDGTTTDTTDTSTDTTNTDTTTTDTTSTDTTSTDTTTTDTTTTETDGSAAAETSTGDGQGENIGEAFATQTPNPETGQPVAPADAADPAAAAGAAAATDEGLGESQLAFTGSDPRIGAFAVAMLGLGASCVVVSRRQRQRFGDADRVTVNLVD